MLDSTGFDLWAEDYDKSVGRSADADRYPFAGYWDVLNRIYRTVLEQKHPVVLDIGFGTGTLTAKLYEKGCEIWGQDFSEQMIQLAGQKMPMAHLFCGDFSQGLRQELLSQTYDFIIATYSLHHLSDNQKVSFLQGLLPLLRRGGKIIIGDVAFPTRAALEQCRAAAGDGWDEDEIYFVYEELKSSFDHLRFEQVSHCAGILTLQA